MAAAALRRRARTFGIAGSRRRRVPPAPCICHRRAAPHRRPSDRRRRRRGREDRGSRAERRAWESVQRCGEGEGGGAADRDSSRAAPQSTATTANRSEENTSELKSLMRRSYAVFCLKKKKRAM